MAREASLQEADMDTLAKFQAILQDSKSAIKISNEGAVTITFEADESQLPKVVGVLLGKDMLLTITVEID